MNDSLGEKRATLRQDLNIGGRRPSDLSWLQRQVNLFALKNVIDYLTVSTVLAFIKDLAIRELR